MDNLLSVFVAAVGFGAGGEAMRRYRKFKNRRRETPPAVRNAGFWNDSRIYHAEAIFTALAFLGPWTLIILAVNTNRYLWWTMLAVLGYPVVIYVFMRSMNMREPQ